MILIQFIFIAILGQFLQAYFAGKESEAGYLKKLEKKKLWLCFCFALGFLHFNEKEIIETEIMLEEEFNEQKK